MIRKFIRRVFGIGFGTKPDVVPREKHGISREAISYGARTVCEVLQQEGFQALVVGGAVRDLLLGLRPKDFDVATDALPEDVHRLFRRSRLIGRRFTIVHVMVGGETVEVSTFRAGSAPVIEEDAGEPSEEAPRALAYERGGRARDRGRRIFNQRGREVDEHGRVTRDNVYGNREQDAARRDFTVNALYYNPADETIIDYHKGLRDLARRSVRIIGDARPRFREDPVRMLRAVRFAAKLGFTLDERTRAPLRELAKLVENVPPARVFDEMQKLLLSGHALACVHQLRIEGLHHGVLPLLDVILEQPLGERFVNLALA
ncbi:MAG: polynucleotide adenylyltransferase PcnB, partial [Betaproteobacteria bacterium]|nr:polynucleotide adenylyltransferase PcnB [Betaproteobacteria bacterium]